MSYLNLALRRPSWPDRLGVSRRTISEILHERRRVTADMAVHLSHLLGTTPASWLNMQQALDIWEVETRNRGKYSFIKKVA